MVTAVKSNSNHRMAKKDKDAARSSGKGGNKQDSSDAMLAANPSLKHTLAQI